MIRPHHLGFIVCANYIVQLDFIDMKMRTILNALFVLLATCLMTGQKDAPKSNYTLYQVGGDVKAPRPISAPVPPPPDDVIKSLKVRLSFVVMPDGSVTDVKLLKRSKSDFDDYAVDVVSKWKFEPATKSGNPVAVRLETEVHSHK